MKIRLISGSVYIAILVVFFCLKVALPTVNGVPYGDFAFDVLIYAFALIGTFEMLRAVSEVADVPIVASGGAGCIDDFITLFNTLPGVDAGLAATIFHFGKIKIPDLKAKLCEAGISVRYTNV